MGWFRDMLSGQQALQESQQRIDLLTADYNEARRERQEAWDESSRLRTENTVLKREVAAQNNMLENYARQEARLESKIELLEDLLTDARKRELRHAELTERVITVERHNATAHASNEWAIAHINMLTAERAALMSDRPEGRQMPVPELRYERGDADAAHRSYTRGAPAQPFDSIDPPPPGPIATAPSIAGVPIPDGQTAGDVLQKLRDRREGENTQANLSPEELLRAGADIFSDLPFAPGESAPTSPFTE